MLLTVLCAAASALRGAPTAANMNAGGAYLVANADGSSNAMWNSSFANRPNAKFFEVLAGPVSTRYGEVFWEGLDAVPLPATSTYLPRAHVAREQRTIAKAMRPQR